MSKIINVGRVTAYADAVKGGYQGTREEWEQAMAGVGSEATAAIEAKNAAIQAKDDAISAKNDAVQAKDDAVSAKNAAAGSASNAHTDALAATAAKEAAQTAQGLAENAQSAAETAQGKAEDAQTAAETAQGAAEDAQEAAETAQGKAEDAQEAAETAQDKAEDAQEAAEQVLESIPADYSTLSSDVTDLKSAISEHDDIIADTDYLINYGYRLGEKLPGTVAASVGIEQNYATVTLNNTEATPGAKIKLNNGLVRVAYSGTSASNTIKSWAGIELSSGHIYKVRAEMLSGTATRTETGALFGVSIYEHGSATSIGNETWDDDQKIFERTFLYGQTPVNVVLLGTPTSIYTNALIRITLEDVTRRNVDEYRTVNELLKTEKSTVNYGGQESDGILKGTTAATAIAVEQYGRVIRLNGVYSSSYALKIKLCGGLVRTQNNDEVDNWTGVNLIVGHTYEIVSTLINGEAVFPDPQNRYLGIPVSVYKNGTHSTIGTDEFFDNKQYGRIFTPDSANNTLALVITAGMSFNNAVFSITLRDITPAEKKFLNTSITHRLFTQDSNERDVAQSCVCVNGCLYVYHYAHDGTTASGHGIRKIDFVNNTDVHYPMNLGHGNGMTYYNGKLYVCDMEVTGKIHVVNTSDMTEDTPIVFEINGTATYTSGIAYDYDNDQFIIKTDTGFAFATTAFIYKSSVARSQSVPGTGQSISCDGSYIYEIKSDPNFIYIFDHSGQYQGKIAIDNDDEAEGMFNAGDGGLYILTNVAYYGWYVDVAQIFDTISMDDIIAWSKLYGAVGYNALGT